MDTSVENGADRLCAGIDSGGEIPPCRRMRCARWAASAFLRTQVSGVKSDRPGLAAALVYLRDGDMLTVWRLDRLGRSMAHLIETIGALEARGVGFRSLTESIDTSRRR